MNRGKCGNSIGVRSCHTKLSFEQFAEDSTSVFMFLVHRRIGENTQKITMFGENCILPKISLITSSTPTNKKYLLLIIIRNCLSRV
jgi:hypothetical protein